MLNWNEKLGFIWSVKEILRDHYKRHEYGQVILPMCVLRRLDCVLEPTKDKVRERALRLSGDPDDHYEVLSLVGGEQFYNISKFSMTELLSDPENIGENLRAWLQAFSPNARDIIQKFDFYRHIERMERGEILFAVVKRFTEIDLHPRSVSNHDMGYLYEELIRVVSDLSNEEAGEHFTPREVIKLMVNLLVADDRDLETPGKVFTVYDPTVGTGGMLTEAEERLTAINPSARVHLYGQEVSEESYAVCRSDLMLKGHNAQNVAFGSTLTKDGFPQQKFTFVLANPPYGKDWKVEKPAVEAERAAHGSMGRFAAGLPGTGDGQMLFLLHMVSKMRSVEEGGSRVAVVLNGAPLFSGDAGSGPSEIRRWLLERDYVEAVIGLPEQMFYNTGIFTYIWILTNRKVPERVGTVQLIDARRSYSKMYKSLGNKRNYMTEDDLAEVTAVYENYVGSEVSQIIKNEDFAYRKVLIDRPAHFKWAVTPSAISVALRSAAISKLPVSEREAISESLTQNVGWSAETQRDFLAQLGLRVKVPITNAILKACQVRDPEARVLLDAKGQPVADPELRQSEKVPLYDDVEEYIAREVLPFASDAWVSDRDGVIGYEIAFASRFYQYKKPRPLAEIDDDIQQSHSRVLELIGKVTDK